MGLPAARETDHRCPAANGPILPPCEPTVKMNGLSHARGMDKASCADPVDYIVTGAAEGTHAVAVNSTIDAIR